MDNNKTSTDARSVRPSPLAWFFSSRKGLLTLFVLLVAVMFAALVGLKVAQDKIGVEAGLTLVGGALLGWFAIAFKTIDAISKEDVAEKSVGKSAEKADSPASPTPSADGEARNGSEVDTQ